MCATASEPRANSLIGLFVIKKTKPLPKLHFQSALGSATPYCVGLDIALRKMKVIANCPFQPAAGSSSY
ncbi:hypothetical protein LA080_009054 [Diaporthe eres]|nr:hypothetical protein LA080_009054 [Diaporthe eres]